jgi:hypothetical protein
VFVGFVLRRRPAADSHDWLLVALVIWAVVEDASVAYGRATSFRPARYFDLYAVGVLANCACALRLALDRVKKPYGWKVPAVAVWCGVVLISLGVSAGRNLPKNLADRRDNAIAQETNTRAYLASGDFKHLNDKPMFQVPFPNAKILASFLDTPEIRAILPANIRTDGKEGRLDRAVTGLLASYPVFIMLGAVVALLLLTQHGLIRSIAAHDSHALLSLTVRTTQTDLPDRTVASAKRLKSSLDGFNVDASRQETYAHDRAN